MFFIYSNIGKKDTVGYPSERHFLIRVVYGGVGKETVVDSRAQEVGQDEGGWRC